MFELPEFKYFFKVLLGFILISSFLSFVGSPLMHWGWEGIFYEKVMDRVSEGQIPFLDFFIEYPPLSVYFISLPAALIGALTDFSRSVFHGIYDLHVGLWLFAMFHFVKNIFLKIGVKIEKINTFFWLSLLGMICIYILVFTRYDIFPAVLSTLGIGYYLLHLHKENSLKKPFILSSFFLILSFFTKIYIGVIFPLVLFIELYRKRWSNILVFFGIFGIFALINIPFALLGSDNFNAFLDWQGNRGVQVESLYAVPAYWLDMSGISEVYPAQGNGSDDLSGSFVDFFSTGSFFILFGILTVIFFLFIWKFLRIKKDKDLIPLFALSSFLLILAFVLFNKVLSPQYLVWLVALIPLFAVIDFRKLRGKSFLVYLLFLIAISTILIYPIGYDFLVQKAVWVIALLTVRNILLLLVFLIFLWNTFFLKTSNLTKKL